ncbi:MAG: hypothetical protein H0U32_04320 [Thermoleophilaceae bacterium]|nr:hypothetical protein [Thermoleophilaceae bacterium]
MRAIGLVVLCAVLAGGCGGGAEPKLDRLSDGRAQGAGFVFELPEHWQALETTEELEREVSDAVTEEIPGLDAQAGFLFAGFWVQPDEKDLRPSVNVNVEPVTADTSLDALATSSLALVEAKIEERPAQQPARLGGAPAVRYSYEDEDEEGRAVQTRGIVVKRGDFAYTLTLQMTGSGAAEPVDELTGQIGSTWRWREPDAQERKDLSDLSDFEGEGYRVTLPPGWRGTGKEALGDSGPAGIDALWRGFVGSGSSTNVNVARLDYPTGDLAVALREVAREERRTDAATPAFELDSLDIVSAPAVDGEPAGALELTSTANGNRLRQLEVVVLRESQLYRITLSSLRERYPPERRAFLEALATWRWE